jgi:ubiquinone/menaquinone biosynthesis C-methylase UbiE
MNHTDHVTLLQNGIAQSGGVWADLGAGTGALTLALAELVGPTATIYAIDKNGMDLQRLKLAMGQQFPQTNLHLLQADFTDRLELPLLDGILMANSLHFLSFKDSFLRKMRAWLKPNGRFLLVEYNSEKGNRWVPYPVSYKAWTQLAQRHGFSHTALLATRPSRFLGEIYAAASW